jgi:hypothetical protein
VLLPFEVTRWFGGRVEFRIQVNEVLLNQPLANTIFELPNG